GALYVPGAERIVPAIHSLHRHAAVASIPVLSTMDAHTEDDPEFQSWPPHCIAGTVAQHKAAATLLENRVIIPNRDGPFSIEGAQQILLEKQTLDAFATRTMRRVIEALNADRFIVYGVVTEICVLWAARGLLAANKQVALVSDAVRELKADEAARAFAEIRSLGGSVTTLSEVLGG
ncbi:MAG TPA: isochorismatase family protein, partial [Bryobacteraceae bacterium]|nr:isochorismatase family protein [Bryobacteraceae bacterium]